MELIPGLTHDLGLECLTRIRFDSFPSVSSVCRAWKTQIHDPYFHRLRQRSGLARPVFVMAQARPGPGPGSDEKCRFTTMGYGLTVLDPETGSWVRVPDGPGLARGLPLFCGVVGVGSEVVVMGGWDPDTWRVLKGVHVFDFLTGQWRRGADMPGPARSLFGLGGDVSRRVVVVAGGHDEEKNALRSAFVYDVASDTWTALPDMARERDECSVVFQRGRFHVIGGYETDSQGCFGKSAECLEPDTWQWDMVNVDFMDSSVGPMCWASGEVYTCRDGHVAIRDGEKWKLVVEMPARIKSCQKMMMWRDTMVVIGCRAYGEPHNAYVLDLKTRRWDEIGMSIEFSGNIQSCCGMEL